LKYASADIGKLIRETRKKLGVTQKVLALTSGTGLRFIIELEKGKETCEIGKALAVLHTIGIKMTLTPPAAVATQRSGDDPHVSRLPAHRPRRAPECSEAEIISIFSA
jgi:HTH-type transcriptional regulator / antitoxin HipB